MRGDQQKRGNRSLSLREKLDAILRVRAGESKASVARELGVPESTLRGWCKTEPKIMRALQNSRRSSQSPESPYSPASSSGGGTPSRLANGSNSSDDEAVAGPSGLCITAGNSTKRRRNDPDSGLEAAVAAAATTHDSTSVAAAAVAAAAASSSPALDYLSVLGSSFLNTNGLTDEQRAMLLQQSANVTLLANMYRSMYSRHNGATSLLGMTNGTGSSGLSNGTTGTNSSSTVNLVDNGLQYVRSSTGSTAQTNGSVSSNGITGNSVASNGVSGVNSSSNSSRRSSNHSSVVAPSSSFMDTIARSASRQSMSPASEPPSTLIPSHHSTDFYNSIAGLTNYGATNLTNGHANRTTTNTTTTTSNNSSTNGSSINSSSNNNNNRSNFRRRSSSSRFVLNENTRQAWMQSSQQLQNSEDTANSINANANFWKYYKTYGLPLSSAAATPQLTLQQQLQLRRSPSASATVTNPTESTASSALTTTALNTATSTTSSLAPTNLCTRSPSEVRATLDSILFANGKEDKESKNDSNSSSSSSSSNGIAAEGEDQQQPTTNGKSEIGESVTAAAAETTTLPVVDSSEALEHGQRFLSWVEDNGDSGLTVLEVLQLRGMLNKVKDSRNPERRAPKRSRK